jgi:hypothetical protein
MESLGVRTKNGGPANFTFGVVYTFRKGWESSLQTSAAEREKTR